jgi:hypothetical protein
LTPFCERNPKENAVSLTEQELADIAAQAAARLAHHEAGHAVAAVTRGGRLLKVHLGKVDWTDADTSRDEPGETHHWTTGENAPFVTFAGPWAQAMWMAEHDPDLADTDCYEILGYAWDDALDGDGAKYDAAVASLEGAVSAMASVLGFPGPVHVPPSWETYWIEELQLLWSTVCEVAALLIDGQTVSHGAVLAAIARG